MKRTLLIVTLATATLLATADIAAGEAVFIDQERNVIRRQIGYSLEHIIFEDCPGRV